MHIQESLPSAPSPPKRPVPRRRNKTPEYMKDQFVPKTQDYAIVAKKYEKYNNNNSTFNTKSLSDGRPITNYYIAKERGIGYVQRKTPINNQAVENQQKHANPSDKEMTYTQNMLNQLYDDDAAIKVATLPSNLTEIPKVHEKYEMNAFLRTGAQYQANLKTLEIIKNNNSGQAILNLNPGFFGEASERAQVDVPLKDPYSDLLQKQTDWQNRNRSGAGVGGGIDLISYTELHHPMSHHNVACGADNLNTYPSDLKKARNEAELVQKGYYSKKALVLDNAYPEKKSGEVLRPLDPRLEKNHHMLGWPNEAVSVNEDLMAEIQKATE